MVDGDQPDAHPYGEGLAFPGEPVVAHRLDDRVGDPARLIGRAVLEQQPELVAAQACHGVVLAHPLVQARGELAQQLVAGRMAAGVVDHLELVEVEVGQRMRAGFLTQGAQQAGEPALELEAVDQAGQRVVGGLVGHLLGDAPLLGHVVQHQHHAGDAAVAVAQRGGRSVDEQLRAVDALQNVLVIEIHQRVAQHAFADQVERPGPLGLVRDVAQVAELAPDHLRRPYPEQRLCHRVQIFDAPFGVGSDHRIADGGQRHLDPALLAPQRLLGALQVGDVHERRHRAGGAAFLVHQGRRVAVDVAHAAVLEDQLLLEVAHLYAQAGGHLHRQLVRGDLDTVLEDPCIYREQLRRIEVAGGRGRGIQQFVGGAVAGDSGAVRIVRDPHRGRHRVQHGGQLGDLRTLALLALDQRTLRGIEVGDVLHGSDHAAWLARVVMAQQRAHGHPALAPVGKHHPVFHL